MFRGPRLRHLTRAYSTIARRSSSRIDKALSLDHFLHRARVLSFYRTTLRGLRRVRDPTTRTESRKLVREEFERHRNVTDLSHIRYLLSTGRAEWESMERYIGGM